MKRDRFTVTVHDEDGPPALDITFDGSTPVLASQLRTDGEWYDAAVLDASFRLVEPSERDQADGGNSDGETPRGVFSLTHRVTGTYLLEVNIDPETLFSLVRSARDVDGEGSYSVRLSATNPEVPDDGTSVSGDVCDGEGGGTDEERGLRMPVVYDLDALFIYDENGDLLRQQSLIPSGVEL